LRKKAMHSSLCSEGPKSAKLLKGGGRKAPGGPMHQGRRQAEKAKEGRKKKNVCSTALSLRHGV